MASCVGARLSKQCVIPESSPAKGAQAWLFACNLNTVSFFLGRRDGRSRVRQHVNNARLRMAEGKTMEKFTRINLSFLQLICLCTSLCPAAVPPLSFPPLPPQSRETPPPPPPPRSQPPRCSFMNLRTVHRLGRGCLRPSLPIAPLSRPASTSLLRWINA